jgi:hypothetical protein
MTTPGGNIPLGDASLPVVSNPPTCTGHTKASRGVLWCVQCGLTKEASWKRKK